MKILCFSDLHRDVSAAKQLVRLADHVDLVLGAGDFANRHEGLADTLDVLSRITTPSVLVPGNGETFEELREAAAAWSAATVLHGDGTEISLPGGSIAVFGIGGGIPVTPFGAWSYDFDEAQATEMLSDCPHGGILLSHSPPLDTVDHDGSGRIRGSQSLRDCVVRCQPRLVVCGHIHSDWTREETLGPTRILNAGPNGIVLEL